MDFLNQNSGKSSPFNHLPAMLEFCHLTEKGGKKTVLQALMLTHIFRGFVPCSDGSLLCTLGEAGHHGRAKRLTSWLRGSREE